MASEKLPNPAATGDVRATAAQHASFRRFADIGDPLADDLVAMMQRLPPGEGRRMFETAVEHGIEALEDPPAELVAVGQRARVGFINRGLSDTGGDRRNRRHDPLAAVG